MIRWTLRGHGIVWQQLLREDVNTQLLNDLRQEFGRKTRPIWSLFVEPAADETQQAQWRGEDSEPGDLPRAIADEDAAAMPAANRSEPGRDDVAIDMSHRLAGEPHFQQRRHERAPRKPPVSNAPEN